MDEATIFSSDPLKQARDWAAQGARRLHVVDLDGAVEGRPRNAKLIRGIVDELDDIPVQVGGGIRDLDTVAAYLDAGVRYVIIGTKAVTEPHFVNELCSEFPGHIIVGLDAKQGRLATDGWSKLSSHTVIDIAKRFESDGVEAIIFTDIGRDGMMGGFNVESTVALAEAIKIPVIASGGVSSLDDVRALCGVTESGIEGAIIGRALYEGALDLTEAQRLADQLIAAEAAG